LGLPIGIFGQREAVGAPSLGQLQRFLFSPLSEDRLSQVGRSAREIAEFSDFLVVLADHAQLALGPHGVAREQLDMACNEVCVRDVEAMLLPQRSRLRSKAACRVEVTLGRREVRACQEECHLESSVDRGA